MAKDRSPAPRERRKPREELPEVPDLGRFSMPRRLDRAAAKYIARTGSPFWDRRRADRAARRRALAQEDAKARNPRRKHLPKETRLAMLASMPDWGFDQASKAFVPDAALSQEDGSPSGEQLEQLLDAFSLLMPEQAPAVRVAGLGPKDHARARGYLDPGIVLVNGPATKREQR